MNPRCLLLLALFALHSIATASSPVTPDVFNVKTYASPSGRFQFEVDPTGRYGGGPGDCKLTKYGRVLWKARLPFTFYDALVADDGTVAGYGYTEGISGMSRYYAEKPAVVSEVSGKDEDGIRVAIFGPDGKQRLHQKFARVHCGFGARVGGERRVKILIFPRGGDSIYLPPPRLPLTARTHAQF